MNQRLDSAGHLMSLLVVMLLASLVTGQNIIDSFEPSDIIANEGGNAIMTCEILSIGSPRIEIRPVGGGFSNVPPDRLETELVVTPEGENNLTRFMYLNVARGEDGTQFRCVYGGSTLSNTGTLDVFFAPQYTDPGDQVVREGNDFSLSIMLDLGDPEAVDFQWQFNGNNINSIARITLTINSIMITGVQQSEDGTYSVTTSNNVGPTTVDFDLDVQFPPVFTVDETCGTVVTEERLEGTDFTLNCEVSGDPTPQLTTSQPSTSSATFDTSTQQFSVISARSEDIGDYTCTATNTVDGEEETCIRTYMVTVDNLPLRVSGLVANVEDNINVVISWSFQDNPELTIMFFSVIITDSSGNQVFSANMVPVPSGDTASISVGIEENLEFETDYTVSVTATNALGVGPARTTPFTTPGQNLINTLEPSDIIANEGGNASITCEILPFGSPGIEIRPVGGGFGNVPPGRLETELVVMPEGENNLTRFIFLNVARGEDGTQVRCVYGASAFSNIGTLDVLLDCGRLSNPTNGEVTFIPEDVTILGSQATYTCNLGFIINTENVDENRFCQNDGTWNGSAPSCQPVDCGPLSIEDGEVSFSSGTTLNSTATYTCSRPFILSGNQTRQCQESGLWSGSVPTCEVDSTTGTGTTEPSGDDDDDDDDIDDVDIVFIVIGIGIFLLAIVIIAAALLYGYYIWKNDS